ncbi:MAG: ABC transporter ATP-binding protein [Candidatus Bathyarchaeia archaeon]
MRRNSDFSVEAKDIVKVYTVGKVRYEALKGVSLSVKHKEIISIVGPSGSGKSTLLNIIGLLDRPTSGKVFIDGVEVSKLSEDKLARIRNKKIGFIFQTFNLVHRLSSVENVELPLIVRGIDPKVRRELAYKMLDAVGLSSKYWNKPLELSGGEQQRVAIARALITNPTMILGDEITGNLDSKITMEIMDLIKKINSEMGTTFIIVTHNPSVANIAHRKLMLKDGLIEREEALRGN